MIDPHKEMINGCEFLMIPVEGGVFDMGSPDDDKESASDEKPRHRVALSGFYIGKYPVVQALWKAVMNGENPSGFQNNDRPVEQVSWNYITNEFLPELRRLSGFHYRLPTEAEWEYAARGGKYHTEGYKYAGSDRLKDVGWFGKNSGDETKPVGQKQPNQLGIYDMSGNVWEWCEDWYGGTDYYEKCKNAGIVTDPNGPGNGAYRVRRGGSWNFVAQGCRVAFRNNNTSGGRGHNVGFRLALSMQADGRPVPALL